MDRIPAMEIGTPALDPAATRPARGRSWPAYPAVWRWHFYAGIFCLPFFFWLAITGSFYLFRPDIETFLDRPYESLALISPRASPSSEARAALAAVPGSTFSHYEPPATPTGAAQVVVARDEKLFRVIIHPTSLRAMRVQRDDHRPMEVISHLHGQLLLGDRGSMIVELAGSWGVIMILTGLYLWFPRGGRLGGTLYPRLKLRGRLFWRDLHAVTGLWLSLVTLFLLLSGLPWAVSWGNYLTWARNHWSATAGTPDWPIGGVPLSQDMLAHSMPAMSAAEMAKMSPSHRQVTAKQPLTDLQALDRLLPVAERLDAPRPVWISPPAQGERDWTISSHVQNRPLRVTYRVDPETSAITGLDNFARKNIVDQVVNVAVATHEGQLFGRINQAILLSTAFGLVVMVTSAAVMWWRRKPSDKLGAPPAAARPQFSAVLIAAIVVLAAVLPLFGVSLVLVLIIDLILLRRLPKLQHWLGLTPSTSQRKDRAVI